MSLPNIPTLVDITVSGGTGTASMAASIGGMGQGVGVIAPNSAASYELAITDADGFLVSGLPDNVGNTKIEEDSQFHGSHTVTITGTDGAYRVKIWFRDS